MSLIKLSIHQAETIQDQPKPTFSEAQWNHLLSTIQDAIHAPSNHSRTDLQNLHQWLRRIRAESSPGA